MTLRLIILVFVTVAAIFSLEYLEGGAVESASVRAASDQTDSRVDLRRLSLSFIPNKGQFPEEVRFAAQATEYDVFFLKDRIVFNLVSRDQKSDKQNSIEDVTTRKLRPITGPETSERIELMFPGRRTETNVSGEGLKRGKFNYLKGEDPRAWKSDLETFDKIRYSGIFEGVDLVFYGTKGRIQYDFVVARKNLF